MNASQDLVWFIIIPKKRKGTNSGFISGSWSVNR